MDPGLRSKPALVTGSTAGIGLAAAEALDRASRRDGRLGLQRAGIADNGSGAARFSLVAPA